MWRNRAWVPMNRAEFKMMMHRAARGLGALRGGYYVAFHPNHRTAIIRFKNDAGLAAWRERCWFHFGPDVAPIIVDVTRDLPKVRAAFQGDIMAVWEAWQTLACVLRTRTRIALEVPADSPPRLVVVPADSQGLAPLGLFDVTESLFMTPDPAGHCTLCPQGSCHIELLTDHQYVEPPRPHGSVPVFVGEGDSTVRAR